MLGTSNVHTNAPVESVWIAVELQWQLAPPVGVWRAELKLSVAPEVWLTVNPEPVTV
jgi:hypothetical protein